MICQDYYFNPDWHMRLIGCLITSIVFVVVIAAFALWDEAN